MVAPTSLSFGSLNHNLNVGNKVLREFQSEYKGVKSLSGFTIKLEKLNKKPKKKRSSRFDSILQAGIEVAQKRQKGIKSLQMNQFSRKRKATNLLEYVNMLKKEVMKYKVANCGEMRAITRLKLHQAGETSKSYRMTLNKKMPSNPITKFFTTGIGKQDPATYDHAFEVIGIKEDAPLDDYAKWGQEAVSVDPWTKKPAMPIEEAMEHYKKVLGFNPKTHEIVLTEISDINPPY